MKKAKSVKNVPEVDQSGKVEHLTTGTAVAFANGKSKGLFMSAGEKRIVVSSLKRHPESARDFAPVFFALLVFLLVRDEWVEELLIDEEYTGKEKIIEKVVTNLFLRIRKKPPFIRFGRIGKLSSAHLFVWKVHRNKGKEFCSRKVTSREILGLLSKKIELPAAHPRISRRRSSSNSIDR